MTAIETVKTRPMTAHEALAFDENCKIVDEGIESFIKVGTALANIQQGRLYRSKYPDCTFEQFVNRRWGKSRQWAYQQISARNLAISLGDTVTLPSERIARALLPLNENPGAQRLTLTLAIATAPDGRLTTEWVESSVAVMQDVLGTEGLVDPGANSEWTAVNAAITTEAHKRMIEKRQQIQQNGHKQKPVTFLCSGEVLQAIAPEQASFSVEKTYRVVVYLVEEPTNGK